MNTHTPHILVYDLDDTLYSEKSFAFSGFEAVAYWLQSHHRIGGFLPLVKEIFNQGHRGNIFNVTLETMALSFDDKIIEGMVHIYRNHTPRIKLFDDAIETLSHFKNTYPQALITDGLLSVQESKINTLKLTNYLDFILCTDSLGSQHWKPHPLPYQTVMNHYNLPPESFTYIADNPNKDFLAPNTLGWQTIRILRPGSEHYNASVPPENEAQSTIASLTLLKSLYPQPTLS